MRAPPRADLDRLALPFRAVSVDLTSGTVYAPRRGSLTTLVRASIGFPVFAPVLLGDRVLTDGGVLENVPAPTARAMGADAVIAVRLSVDGSRLDPVPALRSLGAILGRTYDVVFASQREKALAEADYVVNVAVGDASLSDFHEQLDALVLVGRRTWVAQREAVLSALESRAPDRRTFTVGGVEPGPGVASSDADGLARRLGLAEGPRTLSALRLELELARILRLEGRPDGRLEVHADGRLFLFLDPPLVVRELTLEHPPSLAREFTGFDLANLPAPSSPTAVLAAIDERVVAARRRGLFLCGVAAVTFDPDRGALYVRVEEGQLAGIDIRSALTGAAIATPPELLPRPGQAADVAGVIDAVGNLYQRGAASWVRSADLSLQPDGRARIELSVEEPPVREWSVNLGASDELRAVLWGRMAWPSFTGWGRWGLEARGVVGREGGVLGAETSPAGELRRKLFVRTTVSRALVPHYTNGGDLVGSHGFWAGALAAGVRTPPGRFGVAEAALVGRWVDSSAFIGEAPDGGLDVTADLAWSGDLRDAVGPQGRGVAWSVGAILAVAGLSRPSVFTATFEADIPLDSDRRWNVQLIGEAADAGSDGSIPLDRWTDVGGWWEAPNLLPGRGLSPDARRGTLALRRSLGVLAGATIHAGVSGAAWRIGELRADPLVPQSGQGAALFVEARTQRFGPLILGATYGSLGGDSLFFLFGPYRFPWPGPAVRLPGR